MILVKTRLFRLLLLTVLATSLSACSSHFEEKWKAAGRQPVKDPYAGRWAGEWKSTRGTHGGRLECIFTKETPARYTANFHAHWHGFSSSHTVPFATKRTREGLRFHGQQDLGLLQGGVYKYEGIVTPRTFRVQYDSWYDTGVFELRRVPPTPKG